MVVLTPEHFLINPIYIPYIFELGCTWYSGKTAPSIESMESCRLPLLFSTCKIALHVRRKPVEAVRGAVSDSSIGPILPDGTNQHYEGTAAVPYKTPTF